MVSDRWQLCVCSTVNGTWVSFTFITAGLLFDMETFLIVNKRFFGHIVESAEGSVTTLSLWGFFFLSIVSHLAVFGSSCSVTYVTLLSFSYRNFKQSERSRNDLDRVTTKSEWASEGESGPRCWVVLPSLPPPPLCSAPPGSRCPEGGSRRTNPTHHLSPEQPGGTSFTLQSLPVYTTPCSAHTRVQRFVTLVRTLHRHPFGFTSTTSNQKSCFISAQSSFRCWKEIWNFFFFILYWSEIDFTC